MISSYEIVISEIARRVAWNFPDVDPKDIELSLWGKIPDGLDVLDLGVVSVLHKIAQKRAWKIRAENLHRSCQYSYILSDVYRILESYFEAEGPYYCPADAWSSDRKGAIEVRMDTEKGLRRLNPTLRSRILSRFRAGVVPQPGSDDFKRLGKAVKELQMRMNSE